METDNKELQTLRRELDTFRDENIALYNELTKQNKTLCEQLLTLRAQNESLQNLVGKQQAALEQILTGVARVNESTSRSLQNYLNNLSGMQTAEFITENLLEVKSFKNKPQDYFCVSEEYLRYVLSQTENFGGGGVVFGVRSILRKEHNLYFESKAG